ncbi:MAG: electron transfer flavoprotein subunit beta/FixA family protein [Armatimonadetes bacterium]|nr:electron transfer flavoprotein subunit beta/FixA family protein [Armatimonadota bacterium]
MNIVVCVKQVPDTEQAIRAKSDGSGIEESGLNWILNYYDEHAVEEALRLKEKHGGTVTVVAVGPQRATEAVRTALAMGADEGVLVTDPAIDGADGIGVARVLAKVIADLPFEVILAGRLATDDNAAVVGAALAELLDLPQATAISKLALDGRVATVDRELEGGSETLEVDLPAVFTVERVINEPRYPTLPGIMKAKRKEIKTHTLESLALDGAVGAAAARSRAVRFEAPPKRQAGQIMTPPTPEEAASAIVAFLQNDAKVI